MNGNNILGLPQQQPPQQNVQGSLGQGQIVSGGTVYQMLQTPQGLVAQPIQVRGYRCRVNEVHNIMLSDLTVYPMHVKFENIRTQMKMYAHK